MQHYLAHTRRRLVLLRTPSHVFSKIVACHKNPSWPRLVFTIVTFLIRTGHRVPAVIRGDSGGESWETVYTTDFRVDRPPSQQNWAMDGRSVLPLLKNTKTGVRSTGIGYYDAKLSVVHGWGYRHGKWKYVEGSTSCEQASCHQPQLYDLENDVGERHDLTGEFSDTLANLQKMFYGWHDSVMMSRRKESVCKKVKDLSPPLSLSFSI